MAHKTGLEEYYVIRGQKKMRFGYTTGSCAAAACKGACFMLLGGEKITSVPLMTPKGILLDLELHDIQISEDQVTCAVKKDAGDDPEKCRTAVCDAKRRSAGRENVRRKPGEQRTAPD